jgi:hypothetical protein
MTSKLFMVFLGLAIWVGGCTLPIVEDTGSAGQDAVKAWFDAPLPNSTFWPSSPCQIVAHGASSSGIAMFELSVNGAATSIPSPDAQGSLVTLTQDCGMSEPGKYLLQLRAQDNAGEWSAYAETSLIIVEADIATGSVGGAVFGDQNGDGLQDASEGPLEGVDVVLKGCGPDAMQTTGTDGVFQFVNVPAGSCALEVFKAGWGFSGSSPSLGYPLPVASDPNLPTNVGILMAPMSDQASAPVFGAPQLSSALAYYGGAGCDPRRLTVQIKAQHPDGIKVMVFFHRLLEVNGSKDSGWSDGFSMNTGGQDLYTLSMNAERLVEKSGFQTQARVSYQFVMQTSKGEFVRSAVFSDLQISPCGSPPPAATTTPGTVTPPAGTTGTPGTPLVP